MFPPTPPPPREFENHDDLWLNEQEHKECYDPSVLPYCASFIQKNKVVLIEETKLVRDIYFDVVIAFEVCLIDKEQVYKQGLKAAFNTARQSFMANIYYDDGQDKKSVNYGIVLKLLAQRVRFKWLYKYS